MCLDGGIPAKRVFMLSYEAVPTQTCVHPKRARVVWSRERLSFAMIALGRGEGRPFCPSVLGHPLCVCCGVWTVDAFSRVSLRLLWITLLGMLSFFDWCRHNGRGTLVHANSAHMASKACGLSQHTSERSISSPLDKRRMPQESSSDVRAPRRVCRPVVGNSLAMYTYIYIQGDTGLLGRAPSKGACPKSPHKGSGAVSRS